jgi:hypothetical protein
VMSRYSLLFVSVVSGKLLGVINFVRLSVTVVV